MDLSCKNFYGEHYKNIDESFELMLQAVERIKKETSIIEYIEFRIKGSESLFEKCDRRGIERTVDAAIKEFTDIVGFRIICKSLSEVYETQKELEKIKDFKVLEVKDYIAKPKSSGYRSLHMIIQVKDFPVEVQIRTISQDAWSTLEHRLKYKKEIKNQKMIQLELKRCADDMASADIDMQTLKEIIEVGMCQSG